MHAQANLVHLLAELQIGRRAVDRVAADDEQRVDLSRPHRRRQLANRLELIDRMRLDRIGIEHRLAGIAECRVHRMRKRVHDRRLAFAGNDDARAAMRVQIVANGGRATLARLAAGSAPPRLTPATPMSAASARANSSTWLGFNGRR